LRFFRRNGRFWAKMCENVRFWAYYFRWAHTVENRKSMTEKPKEVRNPKFQGRAAWDFGTIWHFLALFGTGFLARARLGWFFTTKSRTALRRDSRTRLYSLPLRLGKIVQTCERFALFLRVHNFAQIKQTESQRLVGPGGEVNMSKISRRAPRSGAFPPEKLARVMGLAGTACEDSLTRQGTEPHRGFGPMAGSYPAEQKHVNTRIVTHLNLRRAQQWQGRTIRVSTVAR
jgi:hypothetical protein